MPITQTAREIGRVLRGTNDIVGEDDEEIVSQSVEFGYGNPIGHVVKSRTSHARRNSPALGPTFHDLIDSSLLPVCLGDIKPIDAWITAKPRPLPPPETARRGHRRIEGLFETRCSA